MGGRVNEEPTEERTDATHVIALDKEREAYLCKNTSTSEATKVAFKAAFAF